jgi:hypothetical protein
MQLAWISHRLLCADKLIAGAAPSINGEVSAALEACEQIVISAVSH